MNNMKFPNIRLFAAGLLACVWYFLFYPDLCFPEETYAIVYQGKTYDMQQWKEYSDKEQEEIYEQLLQADEEQIIVRSRLVELWEQFYQ